MRRRLAIGVGAAVAVLAAGGGVAVLAWPSGAEENAAAAATEQVETLAPDPNAEPPRIKTDLHTVDVSGSGGSAEVPQRDTERFSLLGVTWANQSDAPKGAIEVRTRSVKSGKWSGWESLDLRDTGPDGAEAADPGRGATEPLWVGPSDGVAARIAGGGSELPAGLRLDLIDPGAEPGGRGGGEPSGPASADPGVVAPPPAPGTGTETDEPETGTSPDPDPEDEVGASATPPAKPPVSTTTGATTPPSVQPSTQATTTPPTGQPTSATPIPTSTVPVKAQFPAYVSRKGWSADETIVKSIDVASEVKVVFVHHTAHSAKANDYACSEAPAIVRAIQSYDVKSDKFSDIGYNYLVDKCGRLYEGRRGGVENAVVPAAIIGFNTGYASIAVIGNYETAASSAAIEQILAQVAAARLGKYGYNPTSKVTVKAGVANGKFKAGESVTLGRLSGHRDAYATACPGANLYARLTAIRALSQEMVTGMTLWSVAGGSGTAGIWYVKNQARISWKTSTPATQINRVEVLVDSKVTATLPGTATSATVSLTPGAHSVAIRAVHNSGTTARLVVPIHGDPTAPSTPSALGVGLRTGTVSATVVPVTFGFQATDNAKLAGYTISHPRAGTAAATAYSWPTTVRPGATKYALTAKDYAGNVSKPASVTRTVVLSAETAAKKTGSWTKKSGSGYLGGKALAATAKNRKLTWTFTGRSAALLFTRSAKSGKAAIYVDGRKVTTVDLKSSKTLNRQAVWTRNMAYGKHTVAIVVLGTSGRPTVVSDGLAYVK
ncbi:N-acetylmuramoyl-L-alanine amidase [Actinoplanes sp. NBC_00393]|uniref:N-acetylmuramoyl-L-alanine amidase n=1 Tax=Actinoplanes sp. NBC_00393 TaxID=2975953 RepID=UPI002E1EF7D3